MRPAFSSTRSAAAFALLLLVLLALPAVLGQSWLPPREEAYSRQGWGSGPYPWIENQIFQETNAIDIAFIGSSHIFNDINTPYVQARLSAQLGRPAVVRTIAWGGAGYDGLYFIARDLLAHRRVRMLVFYDENPAPGQRNNQTPAWFRFSEDAGLLAGQSLREQSLFYCAALIGLPRNGLSLLRPNLPAPLVTDQKNYWEIIADGPNPVTQLGSLSYRRGFGLKPPADATAFTAFQPQTGAVPTDVEAFSPAAKNEFEFSATPLPAWQIHFFRRFAELFRQHHVQPVMLHLPVLAEAHDPVIKERADWPQLFGGDLTLLGIPPVKLFGNLTEDQVRLLYGDPVHFNVNGQTYFTRLITPALINLYKDEDQPNH
jgi:hypothetical protein